MTKDATFPDLLGASVFITGGGSGIGAALTDGFMGQGAQVSFVQRSDASGFVADMQAKHGRAPLFLPCDITDTAALERAMDQAAESHGPIGVLVNNAAHDRRNTVEETTPEVWDEMLAINLTPYFFACRHAARGMKTLGGGAIVNFSSISYMMGMADYPAYTASNAAITGLTRSLARAFGPDVIRVNAIAPGWVLTPRQMELWATPEGLAKHLDKQCLKRHLTAEDMIGPVLFLASNASAMMTGQCMAVDGGVVVSG